MRWKLLMGAYQGTNNQAKTLETAQKVLAVNPCNIRALALLAYTRRAMAEAGQERATESYRRPARAVRRACSCLQTMTKPDGTSDADFQKLKAQTSAIFQRRGGALPRISQGLREG